MRTLWKQVLGYRLSWVVLGLAGSAQAAVILTAVANPLSIVVYQGNSYERTVTLALSPLSDENATVSFTGSSRTSINGDPMDAAGAPFITGGGSCFAPGNNGSSFPLARGQSCTVVETGTTADSRLPNDPDRDQGNWAVFSTYRATGTMTDAVSTATAGTTISVSDIPEPGTLGLNVLPIAALSLSALRVRKRALAASPAGATAPAQPYSLFA